MAAILNFPATSGQLAGFNPLRIGGGGFITGIDINDDYMVCSPDVSNAMIKKGSGEWKPLVTSDSLQPSEYDPRTNNYGAGLSDEEGCYFAKLAPSDKQICIFAFNAYVYRSTDGGATATRCNLPAKKMLSNWGTQRLWNSKAAIHPTDPLRFILGTNGDGVYRTADGGANFTAIGVPAGTNYEGTGSSHVMCYDFNDPNYVYISRHDTGIYRSTTGDGGAFTLVAGGPTSARQMQMTSDGTLWLCSAEGGLWKLARGSNSWVSVAVVGSLNVHSFDITNDGQHLVVMNSDSVPGQSYDGGATWVGDSVWFGTYPAPIGIYQNATDIPWLGGYVGGFYPSRLKFDPVDQTKLWAGHGLGVAYSIPPTGFTRWDWYDKSLGIEEIGFFGSLSIPGNDRPLFNALDKPIWRPRNFDASRDLPIFPSGPVTPIDVEHGYGFDFATGTPQQVFTLVNKGRSLNGVSNDGGATFTPFAAQHPDGNTFGGVIVSTGYNKAIWVPANNGKAARTSDGGASWQYVDMGGSSGGLANWISASYIRRRCLAADHERPGYAVALINVISQGIAGGVYRTVNDGADWTQRFNGLVDPTGDPSQFWHGRIDYIPGKAGELIYTSGRDYDSRLMYSPDDGTNWAALRGSEITYLRSFGFGKAKTGQSYPTVFFDGKVNGVEGVYRSTDFFATTPELLGRFPIKNFSKRDFINGDMNVYGRLWGGFSGNGMFYGNFA